MGDGTSISWGEATLAQHEMRVAMLVKQRDGLDDTIDRHRTAIRILSEAGVERLNEIKLAA